MIGIIGRRSKRNLPSQRTAADHRRGVSRHDRPFPVAQPDKGLLRPLFQFFVPLLLTGLDPRPVVPGDDDPRDERRQTLESTLTAWKQIGNLRWHALVSFRADISTRKPGVQDGQYHHKWTYGPMKSTEIAELVLRGLEKHRQGDIGSAGQIYCEVLLADPLWPDALHLLGIVLHQMSNHSSALDAISQAIALQPNAAHFHANLGEVYRALGHDALADGCVYLALKLRPDRFTLTGDSDLLLRRERQFDDVPLPRRNLPGIAPMASIEHTEAARRLHSRGDRARAFDHLVEAVRHAPGVGLPHSNLGQALLDLGRIREAIAHGTEAVRLDPQIPQTWNALGKILRASGRSMEAMLNYLHALRLAPDMALAHNNVGRILLDAGRANEAMVWLRFALDLDPTSIMIRSNIALALKELELLDEAHAFAEETLSLAPESDEAHLTFGSILLESRRYEEAAGSFRESGRLNPDSVVANLSLGTLLAELGDWEGAERSFREILRRHGPHAQALFWLASLLRGEIPDVDLAELRRLLDEPDLPELLRAELHHAAALVDDARGNYPRSADHVRKANAIKFADQLRAGRAYRPLDHEEFVGQMRGACSAEFFERVEGFGIGTDRLVFIFGLPRSGTSLIEQILASHSEVHGLGETNLARRSFESLPGLLGLKSNAVDCLGRIDRETSVKMAGDLLAKVEAIDRRATLVVDKTPDNYLHLGLLATLFPRAKFIHCRRDLRDIAVSCWSMSFTDLNWTNDLGHIASRFAAYQSLMHHWERVLPVPVLRVDYEKIVIDFESTARAMIDWCGLEWEPACLAFHQAKRVVRTASLAQVRQPIYRRSVERWRNYEEELGPLYGRLDELSSKEAVATHSLF
jgi:tetratricopeptide (TPR) repeat protein